MFSFCFLGMVMYANEVEKKKKEKEKIPKIKINYNIYKFFVIDLDIYRIHLEENHVLTYHFFPHTTGLFGIL